LVSHIGLVNCDQTAGRSRIKTIDDMPHSV